MNNRREINERLYRAFNDWMYAVQDIIDESERRGFIAGLFSIAEKTARGNLKLRKVRLGYDYCISHAKKDRKHGGGRNMSLWNRLSPRLKQKLGAGPDLTECLEDLAKLGVEEKYSNRQLETVFEAGQRSVIKYGPLGGKKIKKEWPSYLEWFYAGHINLDDDYL